MRLPVSGLLSLAEAGQLVVDATGKDQTSVADALIEAGINGAISATGCLHSSTHRNLARYFAHPVRSDRQNVPAQAWSGPIDWRESRIDRYDLVRINRADIERWLSTALLESDIPAQGIESTDTANIAAANRSNQLSPKTVSYADLKAEIEAKGQASESHLMAFARQAFPAKQIPRDLLRRVRKDLFGKPPRGRPKVRNKSRNKSPQ